MPHFLGIDVGTGSARAGVFDSDGHHARLGQARHRSVHRARRNRRAVERGHLARRLRQRARGGGEVAARPRATSPASASTPPARWSWSGKGGAPLPVGRSGDRERNIIVWMDHRAVDQARRINAGSIACSTMSAAPSRRRWKRRSCCGCAKTCPTPSTRPGISST